MPKPILYLYRGEHTWMVIEDIPENEGGWSARSCATPIFREVDAETTLRTVQAELPGYEIRVLN